MALKKGMVYLVGAGPGDYRLITLRGLNCISEADVIVYDRLANPALLSYARTDVELIYVGKSPNRHTMRQDEINAALVQEAKKEKSVVRLKGGDPFVFGRGGEEADFLLDNGINFEVVPGISSSIAGPAYAGIPVTHRGMASSFAVITGHGAETNETTDTTDRWFNCDTLIFLMGMRNLSSIVSNLIEHGRDPLLPVALIQWATTPDQRVLTGNLSNIVEEAAQANFTSPAIIVAGKVASLREKLAWFGKKPLSGKRVMITRPRHQAQKMVDAIVDLGGEPWTFPTIEIAPLAETPMDEAIAGIEEYSWLAFTSINGVSAFFDRMRHLRKDIRSLKDVKISAIGSKTRAELEERGLMVDYVPDKYTARDLANGLKGKLMKNDKVLIPRAESVPDSFNDLRDMGFQIDEVPAYKTVQGSGNIPLIKESFQERKIHILTFTSASTVTNFADMMATDDLQGLLEGVAVACIGPVTANTARDLGITVSVVAKEYTIEGMIASILEHINNERE